MDSLIKADIFFFVSTIAVGLTTVLVLVCLFYIIGALKNFRDISREIKHTVERTGEHVDTLIDLLEKSIIFKLFFGGKKKKSRKKKS